MLTNAQMRPNRYAKLAIGRQKMRFIASIDYFKLNSRGELYIKNGTTWLCADGCAIRVMN